MKQHAIFEREGNNLYCEVPINFAMARSVVKWKCPTLDGRVNLKIQAETRPVKLFRMRGKGVKSVRSGAGATCCAVWSSNPGWPERQAETAAERAAGALAAQRAKNSPRSKLLRWRQKFFDDLTR